MGNLTPESVTSPEKHLPVEYGFKPGAELFPRHVPVSVAYPCNALCPSCPFHAGTSDIREQHRATPFVRQDVWEGLAQEAGSHRAWLRMSGGGEPTLHPRYIEMVQFAKQQGCHIWSNTNGSRKSRYAVAGMNFEILEAVIRAGIDVIEFSVDAGDPETYSVVRAGLDWGVLCRNVYHALVTREKEDRFRNRDIPKRPRIVVSMIDQKLCPDLDAAESYWRNFGVDHVIRRKFLRWQNGGNPITPDGGRESAPFLDSLGEHGDPVPCPWLWERLNVDSDGRVAQCGDDILFKSGEALGYVHRRDLPGGVRTLTEVWRGPFMENLRAQHLAGKGFKQPLCATCTDACTKSWRYNWKKAL